MDYNTIDYQKNSGLRDIKKKIITGLTGLAFLVNSLGCANLKINGYPICEERRKSEERVKGYLSEFKETDEEKEVTEFYKDGRFWLTVGGVVIIGGIIGGLAASLNKGGGHKNSFYPTTPQAGGGEGDSGPGGQ